MIITTSYSPKSFLDLNYTINNQKFSPNKFLIILIGITVFNISLQYFHNKQPIYIALTPLIVLFVIIILIKRRIKKNIMKIYYETPRLSEAVNFEITDSHLIISGSSFKSDLKWNEIHKITYTKNWILIWQNSIVANGLSMSDSTPEFIEELSKKIKLHSIRFKHDI